VDEADEDDEGDLDDVDDPPAFRVDLLEARAP
jgi:hypothetical protein